MSRSRLCKPKLYVSASGEVIPPPSPPTRVRPSSPRLENQPLGALTLLNAPTTDPRLLQLHARGYNPRRPPVNPLHFSHPSVPRFPAFPVPRHVREQIGAHLYRFRLQCNLLPSSVPRSLRLPLSPLMIASWERGAASPWAIYVDRLSQLAGYTLHAEFVESLQARFAPWLDSDGEARVAQEPTAPQPIPFVPLGFV